MKTISLFEFHLAFTHVSMLKVESYVGEIRPWFEEGQMAGLHVRRSDHMILIVTCRRQGSARLSPPRSSPSSCLLSVLNPGFLP